MAKFGLLFGMLLLALKLLVVSMQASYVATGSCSVDVINGMVRDTVDVSCWSGDDTLDPVTIRPSCDFHFEFDPNIFGTTLFACNFDWGVRHKEIVVWRGDSYKDQLQCSDDGPCVWKVTTRGFYWSNQTYGDGYTWNYYTDWRS